MESKDYQNTETLKHSTCYLTPKPHTTDDQCTITITVAKVLLTVIKETVFKLRVTRNHECQCLTISVLDL